MSQKIPLKEKTAKGSFMRKSEQEDSVLDDFTPKTLNKNSKQCSKRHNEIEAFTDSLIDDEYPKYIVQPEYHEYIESNLLDSIKKAKRLKLTRQFVESKEGNFKSLQTLENYISHNFKRGQLIDYERMQRIED